MTRDHVFRILLVVVLSLVAVGTYGDDRDELREKIMERLAAAGGRVLDVSATLENNFGVDVDEANSSHVTVLRNYPITAVTLRNVSMPDLTSLVDLPISHLFVSGRKLRSLSGLSGDKYESLCIHSTNVDNLSVLRRCTGLRHLKVIDSPVTNLMPLAALSLEVLKLDGTRVHSVEPLRGLPLKELSLSRSDVTDLSPVKGMRLEKLDISYTSISNISMLKGMPLKELIMHETAVKDVSILKDMPLKVLYFDADTVTNGLGTVRRLGSLKRIGTIMHSHGNDGAPPLEFWLKYDSRKLPRSSDLPEGVGNVQGTSE